MLSLPGAFTDKMKRLLGPDYNAYIEALQHPSAAGLRVNTSKVSAEEIAGLVPFDLEPVPWCSNGFYYRPDEVRPSSHPLYHCGLFYIQEPSAMAPASFLPVNEGDKVLDLCAAPGGKTTQLALGIQKRGLLVSNDVSASRTKALLKNIELFGLKNTVVTCKKPDRLAEVFPSYFDKILVDAPCSGEGMFRRGKRMISAWEEHGPSFFAPIQREIVSQAVRMLRPGGMMVYSTCTFDPDEDEMVIDFIQEICPEMRILPVPKCDGFVPGFSEYVTHDPEGIRNTVRLFPHKIRGDGHFVALMQKGTPVECSEETETSAYELTKDLITEQTFGKGKSAALMRIQIPAMIGNMPDIRFKRTGLLLGQVRAGRLIPGQAYAMTLNKGDYDPALNLSSSDDRARRYLKGESISVSEDDKLPEKGQVLILIDGFPAGWGTIAGKRIKNNLLPGWRMQS